MKRVISLLILLLILIPNNTFASVNTYERTEDNLQVRDDIKITDSRKEAILSTPKVDEKEKIYDFANLFTDEEEKLIYEKVISYIDKHDMDMVIVTIDDNNKYSAKEYAIDFYDYNYFGINKTYDGLLLLIDMDTREVYINTTGEAQLIYDDYRINDILDDLVYYLSSSNYYQAASNFISSSYSYAESGIADSNKEYEIDSSGEMVRKKSVNWFITIGGSFLVPSLILWYFISKHKGIKLATNADDYIDRKNIIYGPKVDTFFTTHTSRVPVVKSSGGGSGSHGGSTISHGSSGRSHGGGGRHF